MKRTETEEQLEVLNQRLRSGKLLRKSFYSQLKLHRCDYQQSILVKLVPEGAQTYAGRIISQDIRVIDFDIDLDSPDLSRWADVTDQFLAEYQKLRAHRPWDPTVVAYEILTGTMRQKS